MSATCKDMESSVRDPLRFRKKRRQVARACEACRKYRVKCDDDAPCSNCQANGRQCSRVSASSSPEDEIVRLKQKVRGLEGELERERSRRVHVEHQPQKQEQQQPTPSDIESLPTPSTAAEQISESNHGATKKRFWDGVQIRPARSPNSTWFGPSSLYFYISRLNDYMNSALQQYQNADEILPMSANSRDVLEKRLDKSASGTGPDSDLDISGGVYLKPVQEEYFISLFWESYHTSLFAVLDEKDFKEHYQSLFTSGSNSRKPSALVDIVVAMCMQYGMSSLPQGRQGRIVEDKDATVAGRWHYRRGQMLLACEIESPTIATLQAHLLCATFLCGGSFHNMVDAACASAVRISYMLGLHQDPPQSLPEPERQMRRRLWWAVCVLDSKVGMKLGRPFSVNIDKYILPELPRDDLDAARMSGSSFAPIGDNATWLSFNLHNIKLYMVVRNAHTAFYDLPVQIPEGKTALEIPEAMEDLAGNSLNHADLLFREWANNVPSALTLGREHAGRPFSTGGATLQLELYAPMWLQRQRVLLELTYHHLCTNIFRPFVSFGQHPDFAGSDAHTAARKCASHAAEVIHITHQVLTQTSILNGWHEAFQWTWGAALTLIGYILVSPEDPSTASARAAIDLALVVFDIFGASFATAASAAIIMRSHCTKTDYLLSKRRFESKMNSMPTTGTSEMALDGTWPTLSQEMPLDDAFLTAGLAGIGGLNNQGADGTLLDATLGVDFWADLDMLWPESNNLS